MEELLKEWEQKYEQAQVNMDLVAARPSVLIEVAAQHPLQDGMTPGKEFEARLRRTLDIYHKLCASDKKVYIFVPGSLHKGDSVTLSSAGSLWLAQHGVPRENILSLEYVEDIMPGVRVTNSMQECGIASKLFEYCEAGRLICVCSAGQVMRKAFTYIDYGLVPEFETVYVSHQHHSYVWEYFKGMPAFLEGNAGAFMNGKR